MAIDYMTVNPNSVTAFSSLLVLIDRMYVENNCADIIASIHDLAKVY